MCRNNQNGTCDRFNKECSVPCLYYTEMPTEEQVRAKREKDIEELERILYGKMGVKDK